MDGAGGGRKRKLSLTVREWKGSAKRKILSFLPTPTSSRIGSGTDASSGPPALQAGAATQPASLHAAGLPPRSQSTVQVQQSLPGIQENGGLGSSDPPLPAFQRYYQTLARAGVRAFGSVRSASVPEASFSTASITVQAQSLRDYGARSVIDLSEDVPDLSTPFPSRAAPLSGPSESQAWASLQAVSSPSNQAQASPRAFSSPALLKLRQLRMQNTFDEVTRPTDSWYSYRDSSASSSTHSFSSSHSGLSQLSAASATPWTPSRPSSFVFSPGTPPLPQLFSLHMHESTEQYTGGTPVSQSVYSGSSLPRTPPAYIHGSDVHSPGLASRTPEAATGLFNSSLLPDEADDFSDTESDRDSVAGADNMPDEPEEFTPKGKFIPPPTEDEARSAWIHLEELINPRKPSGGRKKVDPKFRDSDVVLERMRQMHGLFWYWMNNCNKTTWKAASLLIGNIHGFGSGRARTLRKWCQDFVADRHALPFSRRGKSVCMLKLNEDLRRDVTKHLQELGPNVRALDLVEYMADLDVQKKFGLTKGISLRTAHHWMSEELGYRWRPIPNGQYVDGHERDDVVHYRQSIYLPALTRLREALVEYDRDGEVVTMFGPHGEHVARRVIIWWHDESVFYANDRRKVRWVHDLESAKPRMKGEGVSLMISDFFSADFGWLCSLDGKKTARRLFCPGKNRDGWFTNEDVLEQTGLAADIVKENWPEYDHVFVFDNATTHLKRPDDALSARHMPKSPSDPSKLTSKGVPRPNFGVDRMTVGPDGKAEKVRIPMTGASHNGQPQNLYFPDNYPQETLRGRFKGMAVILEERGYSRPFLSRLNAECKDFKCTPPPAGQPVDDWYLKFPCCTRRLLYHQPDFRHVESNLEIALKRKGVQCLFLPKYHCELNPIEQCWGYAKRVYRNYPPSKLEEDLKRNLTSAVNSVPLISMRRFFMRSLRMASAYELGLNGRQAAWAGKKYRGHRTIPASIFNELTAEGIS